MTCLKWSMSTSRDGDLLVGPLGLPRQRARRSGGGWRCRSPGRSRERRSASSRARSSWTFRRRISLIVECSSSCSSRSSVTFETIPSYRTRSPSRRSRARSQTQRVTPSAPTIRYSTSTRPPRRAVFWAASNGGPVVGVDVGVPRPGGGVGAGGRPSRCSRPGLRKTETTRPPGSTSLTYRYSSMERTIRVRAAWASARVLLDVGARDVAGHAVEQVRPPGSRRGRATKRSQRARPSKPTRRRLTSIGSPPRAASRAFRARSRSSGCSSEQSSSLTVAPAGGSPSSWPEAVSRGRCARPDRRAPR